MNFVNPPLIVIIGPTGSGKSALAVKLAQKYQGEVISADSRQVYKGLDIGSGKITKREMKNVPHYLLDVASPKKTFTVTQYQKLASIALSKIWQKKKLPILCGGTGFYVQAVLSGTSYPSVKPNLKLRRALEKLTAEQLFNKLKKLDPKRATTIQKENKRRLIRALEIIHKLGKVPEVKTNPLAANILIIGLKPNDNKLKQLIKKRILKRLHQGMIKEVAGLHRNGLSWRRLENFGLEYRFIAKYLQGKLTKDEMINELSIASWHYAKRQMTWFKKMSNVNWCDNASKAQKYANNFLK